MSNINRPVSELNKEEFDRGYEELLIKYDKDMSKHPFPTRQEILIGLKMRKEITLAKYIELSE